MNKTPRIRIPPEVRKYVFERDNYQCECCGKTNLETHLTIDHIIPLAGGVKTISATCKPSAVPATTGKNTTLTPASGVTLTTD